MDKQTQEHLESFRNLARKIKSYHEAIGLLHWDLRTGAPKKAFRPVRRRWVCCPPKHSSCKPQLT